MKSRLYQWLLHPRTLRTREHLFSLARRVKGQSQKIDLFYRCGDPQAHLLLLLTRTLGGAYGIDVDVRLLPGSENEQDSSAAQLQRWRLRDAARFARALDLPLPDSAEPRMRAGCEAAMAYSWRRQRSLEELCDLSTAYWNGESAVWSRSLSRLKATDHAHQRILFRDNLAYLESLGHYDANAIHYDGVFYRGVERLRHLTLRLRRAGLVGGDAAERANLAERLDAIENRSRDLTVATTDSASDAPITLFFSFRSPYSWVALPRVLTMADAARRTIRFRPVRPMVERGVALSPEKRRYLVLDAAREADRYGVPFGRIVDPLGDGVATALAGFFAAAAIGLERRYVEHVMAGIWAQGLNLTRLAEVDRLLVSVGLTRRALEAQRASAGNDEILKANELALSQQDLWGVPTVVVDGRAVWGQDRLWQCTE